MKGKEIELSNIFSNLSESNQDIVLLVANGILVAQNITKQEKESVIQSTV